MAKENRLSPEGRRVMDLIDGSGQIELEKNDRQLLAVMAGLADAMTDEQLDDTHSLLWSISSELNGYPFNFLRFAAWLLDSRRAERREEAYEKLVAFNDGHLVAVGYDTNGPDGRCWYFDCACSTNSTDDDYRATREEALADMTAHMFEHGLSEAAIDSIEPEVTR